MIALWTMVWIWSRLIIGHLELTAAPLVCFYDTTNYGIETGYFSLDLDRKIIFSVWYGRLKRKGISVIIALVPGALAQLVERCVRNAEIRGSNPLCSTIEGLSEHLIFPWESFWCHNPKFQRLEIASNKKAHQVDWWAFFHTYCTTISSVTGSFVWATSCSILLSTHASKSP